MSKTRNQKKREKEEIFFYLAVAAWVLTIIAVLCGRAC